MLPSSIAFFVSFALPVAAWWAAFRAPLGRKIFRNRISIPAPAQAVWDRLDPRRLDFAWVESAEIRRAVLIDDDPVTVAFDLRAAHSAQEFRRTISAYRLEPPHRTVEWVVWDGAAAVPVETRVQLQYELTPAGAATTVEQIFTVPVTGLLTPVLLRQSFQRRLDCLRAAVMQTEPARAPLVSFTGWRIALFSIVASLVMLAAPTVMSFLETPDALAKARDNPVWRTYPFVIVCAAVLGELSILVHELGHAAAMLAFGHRRITISLVPFGGGVALSTRSYATAFEAGVVAVAGVLVTALLCLPLTLLLAPLGDFLTHVFAVAHLHHDTVATARAFAEGFWRPGVLTAVMAALFIATSLLLNVWNILPMKGSDGAQLLESIVPDARARRILALGIVGALALYFSVGVGVLVFGALFWATSAVSGGAPQMAPRRPASGFERLALAGTLCATLGLYAFEGRAISDAMDFSKYLQAAGYPVAAEPESDG
jgi:Zn-dependent protease